MKTIVIIQKDGTLTTGKCADGIDIMEHAPIVADGLVYEIIADSDLPQDPELRGAWTMLDGVVSVDIQKAKELVHESRRITRSAAFKALDEEFALYANKAAMGITLSVTEQSRGADIEAERVIIRDADASKQISIDGATTEAGLLVAHYA